MTLSSHYERDDAAPWLWRGYRPSTGQALVSLALAGTALAGLWVLAPPMQASLIRVLYVGLHESSHAGVIWLTGGTVHDLVVEANAGHVSSSGGYRVPISAAGPLLPAWFSAAALVAGVARRFNASLLAALAMTLSLVAVLGTADEGPRLGLVAWAVMATLGALLPLGGLSRATVLLVFAAALALGVWGALPGLWSAGEPGHPTDVAQIAEGLALPDLQGTAKTLTALIAAGYAIAVFCIAQWLYRHRR